ncbi:serine protease Do [Candidatus Liberibacter solanacearum]|uniref:trypsin-like peptidase domain-containing protein n=1 Tax=Candidatus Liberibacter solanacearum TaxID=556287 RepID=UPI0038711143
MFKSHILSIRNIFITVLMYIFFASTCFVAEARIPPSTDLVPIVERVSRSVVSILVEPKKEVLEKEFLKLYGFDTLPDANPLKNYLHNFFSNEGSESAGIKEKLASGSGFFVTENGYVLTSNHVVERGVSFSVVLSDNTELPAKVIGTDPISDLAVLKVQSSQKFVPVNLEDSGNVYVGETVFTIGDPLGFRGSVNAGIVSARDRVLSDKSGSYIQIDAPINQGNSGGPCFNTSGNVIGVSDIIITNNESASNVGIGLIVPVSVIKKVLPSLIEKGFVDRGWMGVVVQNLTQELARPLGLKGGNGLLVSSTVKDSPSDRAGIKPGDVICAIDGKIIKNTHDFVGSILSHSSKDKVEIRLCKEGRDRSVPVYLESYPLFKEGDAKQLLATKKILGLRLQDFNYGTKKIVRIVDMDLGAEAVRKGIQKGMHIVSVNTNQVSCIKDIESLIEQAREKNRDTILLQLSVDNDAKFNSNFYRNNVFFVSLKIKNIS